MLFQDLLEATRIHCYHVRCILQFFCFLIQIDQIVKPNDRIQRMRTLEILQRIINVLLKRLIAVKTPNKSIIIVNYYLLCILGKRNEYI